MTIHFTHTVVCMCRCYGGLFMKRYHHRLLIILLLLFICIFSSLGTFPIDTTKVSVYKYLWH